MNASTETYDSKLNDYIQGIEHDHLLFEITKLCGYSCFYPIHRSSTIKEVYETISKLFHREIAELFFINNVTSDKISIPYASSLPILEFISRLNETSNKVISPIYQLPCKIVYRLFCDDGHYHGETLCQYIVS